MDRLGPEHEPLPVLNFFCGFLDFSLYQEQTNFRNLFLIIKTISKTDLEAIILFRKAANKWYEFYSFFAAFQNPIMI
jgi:hypothetical protein